jgi:hypothetical protein
LLKTIVLAAYMAGIAIAIWSRDLRSNNGVRVVLILTAVYFASMSVFNQKLAYYLIHILPFYISLLAISITWIWSRAPRWRPVVVVSVMSLIALEIGGILLRAETRSYIAPENAAIQFIRQHAKSGDRIVGSSALIYGLEFDPRLKDDPYLGLKSGRMPDVVVIEDLYHIQFDGWTIVRPEDMARIRKRLAEFQLAYHSGQYEVYLRR